VWNAISEWDVNGYENDVLGYTPWALAESISDYSWHTANIDIPYSDWYGYYYSSDSVEYFKYVQGNAGAFPTVPLQYN
jgi:hypothetical protein